MKKLTTILLLVLCIFIAQANKRQDIQKETTRIKLDTPTDANPVSVGAALVPTEKGNSVLIKANILDGYHIYAYVPAGEAYIKTEYGIELPDGVTLSGKWNKSSPSVYPGKSNLLIYKYEVKFKQAIKLGENVPKGTKIKVWFKYQCCDANICFPPKKKEFELEL